ncbi:alpha/beta hydrolase [Dactylosporangium siamense]|uniref:Proteinase n=1 Tax=Dactylosporangium siamense TaxID=685454 RepID=A0A919Q061_9ACTN|nr:alpha/beta hydrolase [Dactylosporangium siamense]GIG51500.1 proteinase [Dactylosporangium siamense]
MRPTGRSTNSWLRAAAALAVGAGLLAGVAGRAAADPSDLAAAVPTPKLDWADCGGGFQCATATVPRDYGDRRGPTFRLPVIKWPAKDQSRRIGSMFVNPGGPGGSGVGFLRGAPPGALDTFARFDVVSWDPRGIAGSVPAVDCSTPEEDNASPSTTFTPLFELDLKAAVRGARDSVRTCAERNPGILPYLGTANSARDLDLLRRAVGDEKLTYLGMSYGAHIGATYTSLFPGRARALLLDSPVDPDVWANRPFEMRREQNASFENSLDRFFASGGFTEDGFDDLVAAMNRAPLPAPNAQHPDSVRGDDVLRVATHAMYARYDWTLLSRALREAAAGDASFMRDLLDYYTGRAPDGTYQATASYYAVTAQDHRLPRDVQDYVGDARHSYAMFPHQWMYAFGQDLVYAVYDQPQKDVFRGPFRNPAGAAPVLVIAGTHDPATPYEWGRRMVEQLGNARLLTYRADGHVAATDFNPCIGAAMLTYLDTAALPAEGASCTQSAPASLTAGAPPRWLVPHER